MERDVPDQATALHEPRSAIVPLLRGDASGLLGRLDRLEQQGVIPFFASADSVAIVVLKGFTRWGMGTAAVFRDEKREVGMSLAPCGHQAFGGMAFAIIVVRAIVLHHRLGHAWHHFASVRMDERCAQHRMPRGDGPVAVDPVYT